MNFEQEFNPIENSEILDEQKETTKKEHTENIFNKFEQIKRKKGFDYAIDKLLEIYRISNIGSKDPENDIILQINSYLQGEISKEEAIKSCPECENQHFVLNVLARL